MPKLDCVALACAIGVSLQASGALAQQVSPNGVRALAPAGETFGPDPAGSVFQDFLVDFGFVPFLIAHRYL